MKILATHQPQYLPWLGFFDKLDRADLFVLLDNVQFKKREWQNRNRINTATGWQWLTVPVRHCTRPPISEVQIDQTAPWARKHLRALEVNYRRALHFQDHLPLLEEILLNSWTHLAPLNITLIRRLATGLGIDTRMRLASEVPAQGKGTARLVNLCLALGADVYLTGAGGAAYLDLHAFAAAGIEVRWQEFCHPIYPQPYNSFEPNLSIVDLLLNCGDESLDILRSTRSEAEQGTLTGSGSLAPVENSMEGGP